MESNNIAALVRICNEPAIYDFLFRERLEGQPYPTSKAESFISWGASGWREGTHFVFIVTTDETPFRIVAAADIKSADLNAAEVGYWASVEHSGVMTPVVSKMCSLAKEAGYQSLFARVRKNNSRSISVLSLNDFEKSSAETTETHFVFRRKL